MKINGAKSTPASGLAATTGALVNNSSRLRAPGQALSPDQAQLSSLSAFLSSVQSNSPSLLSKLSSLTAEVSSGRYHVDANVVSGNIIEDSMRLAGSNSF